MRIKTAPITTETVVFRLWKIRLIFTRNLVKDLNLILLHETKIVWGET